MGSILNNDDIKKALDAFAGKTTFWDKPLGWKEVYCDLGHGPYVIAEYMASCKTFFVLGWLWIQVVLILTCPELQSERSHRF